MSLMGSEWKRLEEDLEATNSLLRDIGENVIEGLNINNQMIYETNKLLEKIIDKLYDIEYFGLGHELPEDEDNLG